MTSAMFASLSSSAFSRVVAKRQKFVAAQAAVEAIMEADPCDKRCNCSMRAAYDAAIKAEHDAYYERMSAEESWRTYCEIRRDDRRVAGM